MSVSSMVSLWQIRQMLMDLRGDNDAIQKIKAYVESLKENESKQQDFIDFDNKIVEPE